MPTDDDFDDDRPARRPRNSRDDDDDAPPARRRRDDDDGPRRSGLKPHRGTMILIFGILATIQCCAIVFGLLAIFMGQADLKEMDAGRMDPSGRGQTKTGVILGIVGLCLMIVLTILRFTVFAGNQMMQ
jgi:hypothetical protein